MTTTSVAFREVPAKLLITKAPKRAWFSFELFDTRQAWKVFRRQKNRIFVTADNYELVYEITATDWARETFTARLLDKRPIRVGSLGVPAPGLAVSYSDEAED